MRDEPDEMPVRPDDPSHGVENSADVPASERHTSAAPEQPSPDAAIHEPPWGFIDLGAFVLFAAVTLFLAMELAVGAYSALFGRPTRLETSFVVFMQLLWEVFWFGFIYITVTAKYRRPFWDAVRWKAPPQGLRLYLMAGLALAPAAGLISRLFPYREELPIERLFDSPGSAYLLALFGICVAPFIEELVFRGFFYPVFERRWGFLWAVLLTALLFAAIHGPQVGGGIQMLVIFFCIGAALSYARGKTGSLVPSYLMHLAYNSTLFVSLYLGTDRFRTLPGSG
jgi:membrane protease YdiL (CAAX protease family)